jgi:hypothetical protein
MAGSAYMYVILLFKLRWIDSGCQRKIYMTKAQLKLAKKGHAFALMCARAVGVISEDRGFTLGSIDSFASASITRAKTYITI